MNTVMDEAHSQKCLPDSVNARMAWAMSLRAIRPTLGLCAPRIRPHCACYLALRHSAPQLQYARATHSIGLPFWFAFCDLSAKTIKSGMFPLWCV